MLFCACVTSYLTAPFKFTVTRTGHLHNFFLYFKAAGCTKVGAFADFLAHVTGAGIYNTFSTHDSFVSKAGVHVAVVRAGLEEYKLALLYLLLSGSLGGAPVPLNTVRLDPRVLKLQQDTIVVIYLHSTVVLVL